MRRRLSGRLGAYQLESRRLRKESRAVRRDVLLSPELEALLASKGNSFLPNWVTQTTRIDDEMKRDMRRQRARARDLEDSSPFVPEVLKTYADNVIGPTGFGLSPQNRTERGELLTEINKELKRGFLEWASEPVTTDGKQNLVQFEHLLLKSMVRDGEQFVRSWRGFDNEWGLAFEGIDPDLVDEYTNQEPSTEGGDRIVMGIQLDRFNRPTGYHLLENASSGYYSRRVAEVVPASQVRHLHLPKRVGQTRTASWLVPALVSLKFEEGYTEAELTAAVLGASSVASYEKLPDQPATEPEPEQEPGTGKPQFVMDLVPGSMFQTPDGYTLKPLKFDHPTNAYMPFNKAIVRRIATATGLGYPDISNDQSEETYSSGRTRLLKNRDRYWTLQEYWAFAFRQWVYMEWLTMALLNRKLRGISSFDPRQFRAVKHIGRGWQWVDPLKDGAAAVLAIKNGLDSRTHVLDEMGMDFREIAEELQKEEEIAAELNIPITDNAAAEVEVKEDEDTKKNGNGNGDGGGRLRYLVRAGRS